MIIDQTVIGLLSAIGPVFDKRPLMLCVNNDQQTHCAL